MDFDTAILLAVTACACCWYVSFGIREEKRAIKAREREASELQRREERVSKLYGR